MSFYSRSVFDQEHDYKPRALSREELEGFSFERTSFAHHPQNSYMTRYSNAPINSVSKHYSAFGGPQNSIERHHVLGGYAYDPGNSSDRWRWAPEQANSISRQTEEELERVSIASMFAKNPKLVEMMQKKLAGLEPEWGDDDSEADDSGPDGTRVDGSIKPEKVETPETGVEAAQEDARTLAQAAELAIEAGAEWVVFAGNEGLALFMQSQTALTESPITEETHQQFEREFDGLIALQRKAEGAMEKWRIRLATDDGENFSIIARRAARALKEIDDEECWLDRSGPKVLSEKMHAHLVEFTALEPFVGHLQTFQIEEISPKQRTLDRWRYMLECRREEEDHDEDWLVDEDEFETFVTSQLGESRYINSIEDEQRTKLQKLHTLMLEAQSASTQLVASAIANINVHGFDNESYGQAAHKLSLRILTLESSLEKQGPWVLDDIVRHSLLGLAAEIDTGKAYWAKNLGVDWYSDQERIELGCDEFDEEDFVEEDTEGPQAMVPKLDPTDIWQQSPVAAKRTAPGGSAHKAVQSKSDDCATQ